MPKASREPKTKAGAFERAAVGQQDSAPDQDAPQHDDKEHESRAKRTKGKGRATKKVVKRKEVEEIVKPPLYKQWADIPDWKGKKESPLMKLPAEVLEKIFCVRPELAVSYSHLFLNRGASNADRKPADYLALAGTCRFFRSHMTDDFWEVRFLSSFVKAGR
jgi:hypothetical protein